MKRPHGFDGGTQEPLPKRTGPERRRSAPEHRRPGTQPDEGLDVQSSHPAIEQPEHPATPEVRASPPVAPMSIHGGDAEGPPRLPEESSGEGELAGVTPREQLAMTSARAKQAVRELKQAQRQRRAREKGERRRFTQMSRSRRRRWVIGLGGVLALALFVTVGVFSPALNLQKVTVIGAERLDPTAVAQSLDSQLGKPLAFVDRQSIHESLSAFNLISEYSIETMPPHELIVRIVERHPVLNLKRGDSFDLVDPAGVVIQSAPERIPGYPIGDALVVDVNSPAFTAAAQSLAYMQSDLAAQVDIASATTDQDVTFKLASGLTIIWGSSENSVRKSVLVNKMLASLAGQPVNTINVSSTQAPVFS